MLAHAFATEIAPAFGAAGHGLPGRVVEAALAGKRHGAGMPCPVPVHGGSSRPVCLPAQNARKAKTAQPEGANRFKAVNDREK